MTTTKTENTTAAGAVKMTAAHRPLWARIVVFIYRFLFSLSGAITLMIPLSWPLLRASIALQHTDAIVGLSPATIMHNYDQLMAYLFLPWVGRLKMSDFPTSPHAAIHFAQCGPLFWTAVGIFAACLVVWIIAAVSQKLRAIRPTLGGTVGLMVLFVVLAVVGAANFDALFVGFHHLFFHNNYWLFDPATDLVIDVLTEQFFAACAGVVALFYELSLVPSLVRGIKDRR